MPPYSRYALMMVTALVAPGAFAVNVVVNPDFDEGTTAWSSHSSAVLSIEPGDGSPAAPALDLTQQLPSGIGRAVSECAALSAASIDFIVRAKFPLVQPSVYAHAFLIFYPTTDCTGTTTVSDVIEWRPPQAGWVERALPSYPVPGDTQSVQVFLRADAFGSEVQGHMLFDHIRLGVAGSVPVELQAFDVD